MTRPLFIPLRTFAAAACLTAVCLAAALSAAPAAAKDLGVHGETWPIAEPDLLAQIEARLAALQDSGALARFEREAKARALSRIEDPPRVEGIAPAREHRSRPFDPAIVVERDILTPDGTVIASAGTRIDPFAHHPLTRDLLFIDGTRAVEIAWALRRERPSKIVLLAGRPFELARAHGRVFFFDQGGVLARRFGLRATPSLVTQDGAALRITEIPLDDDADSESDREVTR